MALKLGSRRFPKFRGACNVTWTPPQFTGRRAEWAGRAKRRDTEVTRDGAPESSVFRQSLISAWLESGALGGDLLPRCSTHPRCCLRRRRSKAQDGRQNARRIAEGQFKGSFLGISVSQRVFRCGLGPPETCGPRELTGVRAGGLLATVGLAPLHQGAQVERPESARPSRPGFSPTLTCLGAVASGARPSFDFGVRPVVRHCFGVLGSHLAALGGRGASVWERREGSRSVSPPHPPPSLFRVSLAPSFYSVSLIPSGRLAWTVASVGEARRWRGLGAGRVEGAALCASGFHMWLSHHFSGSEE